ncbi:hypothetical protein [Caulobacter sp. NIBR1757]|uniref:hypothetical protein n=1 Tax=Caulobacter sp. NIBR1757 TaxID=3016000 RepID=UPI0022F12F8E|nr:hypothetical protein [Caulobacter sp. NIBR1757]WGM38049.1 hypothetical protein AMEJIAPC_00950 [Caulobacter sp. NIBR1757]
MLAACLFSSPALSADCWFENGAVVAPASVAGIAGDYLIDPSAPNTLIHETRAQTEGIAVTELTAPVRVAGLTLKSLPVRVVDLDFRAPGFDTPIAGVIGADALAGQVVDLDFAPCRVRIHGASGRRARGRAIPLTLIGGVPTLRAAVSDDDQALAGQFAVDWSSAGKVRLSDRIARFQPAREGYDPLARNDARGRLRAFSFLGELSEEAPSGLIAGLDPSVAGSVGTDVWSRWTLRLDMARRVLILSAH